MIQTELFHLLEPYKLLEGITKEISFSEKLVNDLKNYLDIERYVEKAKTLTRLEYFMPDFS